VFLKRLKGTSSREGKIRNVQKREKKKEWGGKAVWFLEGG